MRHSVEARADRWQRRHTGPWRTVDHDLGLVIVSHRYRRRPRIEYVRLWVALHDCQRDCERALLVLFGPFVLWMARRLPR